MINIKKAIITVLTIALLVTQLAVSPRTEARAENSVGIPAYCIANELYLRSGPGTEYDIILLNKENVILKKGQAVQIIDTVGEWYHIGLIYNNIYMEGYSFAQYISTQRPPEAESMTPEPTAEPTPEPIKFSYEGAIYEHPAAITANTLNLRKAAKSSSKKLATLKKDTQVTIINSKIYKNQRWYRVAVDVKGKTKTGYMLSDYIKLDTKKYIDAETRVKNIVVYTGASTAKKQLKDKEDEVIKLKKNFPVKIMKEVTAKDGTKWFRIKFKYDGKTKKGYVQALKIKFSDLTKPVVTEEAKTEQPAGPEIIVDTKPKLDLGGGNAYLLENAKSLSIKELPEYSAAVVKDSSGIPVMLYSGHALEVVNAVRNEDADWYYIRCKYKDIEYFGYINSIYVRLIDNLKLLGENGSGESTRTKDFETKLAEEGFPESYKEKLRVLHASYPNWEFRAYHTGLDWQTVIDNESTVGRNLIPKTKSVEWLSFEPKAYNWKKDQFIVFDGSTWVTASKEAIEYYMDPRNFLDMNTIFQFEVLTYQPSYQNLEGIENVLKNSAMSNRSYEYKDADNNTRNITYSETFAMAAEYSGVSPFHLASRVKQEIVIGTDAFSNSVTGTVEGFEGLYNFYNIGAYHSTEPGGAIRNGLKFARFGSTSADLNINCLIPWDSRFRSIVGGAFYIGNNYINRGQDTIYLQKFNVTPTNTYTHQYMANVEAPFSEGKRVYTAYEGPEKLPIVFSIPVYLNMPEQACAVPEKKYNPNNWLNSLDITDMEGNNLALTPTFDASREQEYSIIVDNSIYAVAAKAAAVSSKARVDGNTTYSLETGNNRLSIAVTAENGDVREYIVNIVRDEAAPGDITGDAEAQPEESEPQNNENVDNSGVNSENGSENNSDNSSEGSSDQPGDPVIITP